MNLDFPGIQIVRVPIKYGIIGGFIFSIQINIQHIFREHWLDLDLYSAYISLPILLACISLGVKEKNKFFEGKLSYMNSIQTGLLISLVMALATSFFMYIYSEYINTDWVDVMKEKFTTDLINADTTYLSKAERNKVLAPMLYPYSTTALIKKQFIISLVAGSVFSVIAPALFSKKGPYSYRNSF